MNVALAAAITPEQDLAIQGGITGIVILASLGWGIIGGFIGALIGAGKDRKALGVFLGTTLGILGWLIMLFVKRGYQEEGLGSAFKAFVGAVFVNVLVGLGTWNLLGKPAIEFAHSAEESARLKELQQKPNLIGGQDSWEKSDSGVVSGVVKEVAAYGLVINADDEDADSEPLLAPSQKSLHPATWKPNKDVTGTVFLTWHPQQETMKKGDKVRVIANPIGYVTFPTQGFDGWTLNFDDPEYVAPPAPRATPFPIRLITPVPKATPTAEQMRAEIERKYGKPK